MAKNTSAAALQTISGNNGGFLLVTGAIGTGNRFLLQAFEGLNGQIQRFRLRLVPGLGVTDARQAVVEHGAVVDALATRDPEAVEDAVRNHLERVRDRALVDRSSVVGDGVSG